MFTLLTNRIGEARRAPHTGTDRFGLRGMLGGRASLRIATGLPTDGRGPSLLCGKPFSVTAELGLGTGYWAPKAEDSS